MGGRRRNSCIYGGLPGNSRLGFSLLGLRSLSWLVLNLFFVIVHTAHQWKASRVNMSPFTKTFCHSGSWQNSSQLIWGSSQGLDCKLLSSEGGLLLRHTGDTGSRQDTQHVQGLVGMPPNQSHLLLFSLLGVWSCFWGQFCFKIEYSRCRLGDLLQLQQERLTSASRIRQKHKTAGVPVKNYYIRVSSHLSSRDYLRAITLADSCFNGT